MQGSSRCIKRLIGAVACIAVFGMGSHVPSLSAFAAQATAAQASAPRPTGILLGKVVEAASGKPIDGAIVTLTGAVAAIPTSASLSAIGNAPRQILTDSSGRFLFHDVAKGQYALRAYAPGCLSGGYGQNRPDGSTTAIDLGSDAESRGDLTVRLWKTASITGTILDETGEPIVDKNVRLFRRTMSAGQSRLSLAGGGWTDDRGVYRFANLTPGTYLVAVMSTQVTMPSAISEAFVQQVAGVARDLASSGASSPVAGGYRVGDFIFVTGSSDHASGTSPAPAPTESGRIFVYPSVYYRAAAVSPQATPIELGSGEDKIGIDLQIKLAPTARVSGRLIGPDGPAPNQSLKLFPVGTDDFTADSGPEAASTVTDPAGLFTFLGVTPGQYMLKSVRMPRPLPGSAVPFSAAAPLPPEPTLWATQAVVVGEADLTGLSVALRPGARISGRFIFDGTTQPTSDQMARALAVFTPASVAVSLRDVLSPSTAVSIDSDGRFVTIGYPPGRYVVSANLRGTNWSMTSARLGSKEVSDEGLDVSSADISDLVIKFSDHTTELAGLVRDTKGAVDGSADVIVIPADSEAWKRSGLNARRLRSVRTATSGLYTISNLPPGSYLIAAVSDETLGDWQDPKVLEAIAAVATRMTLGDAEKKSLDLTTRVIR